jgi:hypothetical protein
LLAEHLDRPREPGAEDAQPRRRHDDGEPRPRSPLSRPAGALPARHVV